jgi:hypothetical protein
MRPINRGEPVYWKEEGIDEPVLIGHVAEDTNNPDDWTLRIGAFPGGHTKEKAAWPVKIQKVDTGHL